jgi:hypothetical protein
MYADIKLRHKICNFLGSVIVTPLLYLLAFLKIDLITPPEETKAYQQITKQIESDPENPYLYRQRIALLFKFGSREQRIADHSKIIEILSQNPDRYPDLRLVHQYYNRAQQYKILGNQKQEAGELEQAKTYYHQAIADYRKLCDLSNHPPLEFWQEIDKLQYSCRELDRLASDPISPHSVQSPMLYVFAILAAPAPDQEITGINKPIAYIQVDNLLAAYEPDIDIEALKRSEQAELLAVIVQHDRITAELFAQQTLLPLRFGTAFVSEAALRNYLQDSQAQLSDRLNQLSGYGEYLLKGQLEQAEVKPDTNLKGREYLLAKKQQYEDLQQAQQRQKEQQSQLIELLRSHTSQLDQDEQGDRDYLQIATTQEAEDLRVYLLLTQTQAEQLNLALQQWLEDYPAWQLTLSEPLPPYHFAEA